MRSLPVSLARSLLAAATLFALTSACSQGATGGASADNAPVEAAARALLTGYAEAQDGAQAETALSLFATPGFIDRLKAQALSCRTAAASGSELPASCDKDPLFCGEGPAPLAGVSVKSVSAGLASAEVGITQPTGAVTSLMTLAKVGETWKVDGVSCAQ